MEDNSRNVILSIQNGRDVEKSLLTHHWDSNVFMGSINLIFIAHLANVKSIPKFFPAFVPSLI
jgi:hypothetical protein